MKTPSVIFFLSVHLSAFAFVHQDVGFMSAMFATFAAQQILTLTSIYSPLGISMASNIDSRQSHFFTALHFHIVLPSSHHFLVHLFQFAFVHQECMLIS